MQDPIADMLTRIRNAGVANKLQLELPVSKQKVNILNVLKSTGYIEDFKTVQEGNAKKLVIRLKYWKGKPVIRKLQRVSKPGLRVYRKVGQLEPVAEGLGINILTTSKGVMTDKQAKSQNLGGEILCKVF